VDVHPRRRRIGLLVRLRRPVERADIEPLAEGDVADDRGGRVSRPAHRRSDRQTVGAEDRFVAEAIVSPTTSSGAKRSSTAAVTDGMPRAVEGSCRRLARGCVRGRRIGTRLRSASHSALSKRHPMHEQKRVMRGARSSITSRHHDHSVTTVRPGPRLWPGGQGRGRADAGRGPAAAAVSSPKDAASTAVRTERRMGAHIDPAAAAGRRPARPRDRRSATSRRVTRGAWRAADHASLRAAPAIDLAGCRGAVRAALCCGRGRAALLRLSKRTHVWTSVGRWSSSLPSERPMANRGAY
jgi:hypothetical protein